MVITSGYNVESNEGRWERVGEGVGELETVWEGRGEVGGLGRMWEG